MTDTTLIEYARIRRLLPDTNAAVPLRRMAGGRVSPFQPVRFARWAWAFWVRFMAAGQSDGEQSSWLASITLASGVITAATIVVVSTTGLPIPWYVVASDGGLFLYAAFWFDVNAHCDDVADEPGAE